MISRFFSLNSRCLFVVKVPTRVPPDSKSQKHLRLFPSERDTLRRVFVLSFNSLIVFGRAPYFWAAMIRL